MQHRQTQMNPAAQTKIVNRAKEIVKSCPLQCREFAIKRSVFYPDRLFLQWTRIDTCNLDRITSHYEWECFTLSGERLDEQLTHASQELANEFFVSLEALHYIGFPK